MRDRQVGGEVFCCRRGGDETSGDEVMAAKREGALEEGTLAPATPPEVDGGMAELKAADGG